MQRIAIDITVDRHGANAHFLARPDNATGNLAAVRDQDLFELSNFRRHLVSKVQCSKSKVFLSRSGHADFGPWTLDLVFDAEQRLAILDRLSVLNVNLCHLAAG